MKSTLPSKEGTSLTGSKSARASMLFIVCFFFLDYQRSIKCRLCSLAAAQIGSLYTLPTNVSVAHRSNLPTESNVSYYFPQHALACALLGLSISPCRCGFAVAVLNSHWLESNNLPAAIER